MIITLNKQYKQRVLLYINNINNDHNNELKILIKSIIQNILISINEHYAK